MPFIRIKKVKGKEYAYLVGNSWKKRKKAPRQKVHAYLGRVYRCSVGKDTQDMDFLSHFGIQDIEGYAAASSQRKIIQDLVTFELARQSVENRENLILDNESMTFRKGNREIVLKMNEGYLCEKTISDLCGLASHEPDESFGLNLAKAFVLAGIDVPKEIFVAYFHKVCSSSAEDSMENFLKDKQTQVDNEAHTQ